MQVIRDADKRFRWKRCPLCGKRYKQFEGAPLGACDECLGELCDAFWAIYDRNHPRKDHHHGNRQK